MGLFQRNFVAEFCGANRPPKTTRYPEHVIKMLLEDQGKDFHTNNGNANRGSKESGGDLRKAPVNQRPSPAISRKSADIMDGLLSSMTEHAPAAVASKLEEDSADVEPESRSDEDMYQLILATPGMTKEFADKYLGVKPKPKAPPKSQNPEVIVHRDLTQLLREKGELQNRRKAAVLKDQKLIASLVELEEKAASKRKDAESQAAVNLQNYDELLAKMETSIGLLRTKAEPSSTIHQPMRDANIGLASSGQELALRALCTPSAMEGWSAFCTSLASAPPDRQASTFANVLRQHLANCFMAEESITESLKMSGTCPAQKRVAETPVEELSAASSARAAEIMSDAFPSAQDSSSMFPGLGA